MKSTCHFMLMFLMWALSEAAQGAEAAPEAEAAQEAEAAPEDLLARAAL